MLCRFEPRPAPLRPYMVRHFSGTGGKITTPYMVSCLRACQIPYGLMVSDTINTPPQSAHKCHTIYGHKFINIFTKYAAHVARHARTILANCFKTRIIYAAKFITQFTKYVAHVAHYALTCLANCFKTHIIYAAT